MPFWTSFHITFIYLVVEVKATGPPNAPYDSGKQKNAPFKKPLFQQFLHYGSEISYSQ